MSLSTNWLKIREGVILNSELKDVIIKLDPYFGEKKFSAWVTSGVRSRTDQLNIIKYYANLYHLNYPEFEYYSNSDLALKIHVLQDKELEDPYVYWWQRTWSKLLNLGVIISPPYPAVCLYDYIKSGINKKGQYIPSSPHLSGKAFDIGGRTGSDPSPNDEFAIVSNAKQIDLELKKKISSILLERANNCVHVNII